MRGGLYGGLLSLGGGWARRASTTDARPSVLADARAGEGDELRGVYPGPPGVTGPGPEAPRSVPSSAALFPVELAASR
jgi:hypothetical protein